MAKCKNCQHQINLFKGEYWHVQDYESVRDKKISYELNKNCEKQIENKEACDKCGSVEQIWCQCENPEPELDEVGI